MEAIASLIRAHNKNVIGCISHKRDVMISLQTVKGSEGAFDFYLTQEQGYEIYEELGKVLKQNKIPREKKGNKKTKFEFMEKPK